MGDARLAFRLIGGSNLIPHHVSDDGRAVIGNDDDLKPILQGEALDIDVESKSGKRLQ
jgi:hypothetical protein